MAKRKDKICIVLGTRPEIVKMMSIIQACEASEQDYFIIHSGQHYSYQMDAIFFEELEIPKPKYNIAVGSGRQGEQTGEMLKKIEAILLKEMPDLVLVQGDTNTVLAGALAATKLHIKIGHIEAGLRSFDRRMPEEINRILTDHMSDYLFAPTKEARMRLLAEGIPDSKIYVTGNTIVDAVLMSAKIAMDKSTILSNLALEPQEFGLITLHRSENVDHSSILKNIIEGIEGLGNSGQTFIWPLHPRTKKSLEKFGLLNEVLGMPHIKVIEPVGFFDFLILESSASVILTDSGGVQEEACILQVPCITLRDSTERPETIKVGANRLVGNRPEEIVAAVMESKKDSPLWHNPLGNGKTGELILKIISDYGVKMSPRKVKRAKVQRVAKSVMVASRASLL